MPKNIADKAKTPHQTLLAFIKSPFVDFTLEAGLVNRTGEIITQEHYKIQADELTQEWEEDIAEVIKGIGLVLRRNLTAIETVILFFKETASLVTLEIFAPHMPPFGD